MQKLIQKLSIILNSQILLVFIILIESLLLVYLCFKKDTLSDVGLYLRYSTINPSFDYATVKQFDKWIDESGFLEAISTPTTQTSSVQESTPNVISATNEMYSFDTHPYQTSFTKLLTQKFYHSGYFHSIHPKWIGFIINLLFYILTELLIYFFVLYLTKNRPLSLVTMLIIGTAFYTLGSVLNSPPTFLPSVFFTSAYLFLHIVMLDRIDRMGSSKRHSDSVFVIQLLGTLSLLFMGQFFIDSGLIIVFIAISLYFIVYCGFKQKLYFLSYTLVFLLGILGLIVVYKDFALKIIQRYLILRSATNYVTNMSVIKYYILDNFNTHFFINIFIVYLLFKILGRICSYGIDQKTKDINLTIFKPSFNMVKINFNPCTVKHLLILIFSFLITVWISLVYNQPDTTYCVNYVLLGTLFFIGLSCLIKNKSSLMVYTLAFLFIGVLSLRTGQKLAIHKIKFPAPTTPHKVYIYVPNLTEYISKPHLLDFIKYVPKDTPMFISATTANIMNEIKKDIDQDQTIYLITTNSYNIDSQTQELMRTTYGYNNKHPQSDTYSFYLVKYTKNLGKVDKKQ